MKKLVSLIGIITSLLVTGLGYGQKHDISQSNVHFMENKGQIVDQNFQKREDVLFGGQSSGLTFHLRKSGISYQLYRADKTRNETDPVSKKEMPVIEQQTIYRIDVNWLNTNADVQLKKGAAFEGFDNFYNSGCPDGVLDVKSFSDVTYQNLYRGIDLKWYQKDNQLKYDYLCAAGSDYSQIKLQISGADQLFVDSDGNLIIETPLGKIIEQAPLVLQDGKKLKSEWILNDDILSFNIYDLNKNVSYIIDPIVRAWGTYYGTVSEEKSYSTKSDNNGNVYITGKTGDPASGITLATSGAHQTTFSGNTDCFLVKFNTSGVREWGTYYGGTQEDYSVSCDIDSDNNVYIAGYTVSLSGEGIETSGSYQESNFGNFDAFLVKFNSSGVRQWGTYFGGPGGDYALSCKTDLSNNIYLTGYTNSLSNISTYGVQQPNHATGASDNDGFLAKFDTSGSILWSRYFGGGNEDKFYSVATDKDKNVYITGETTSPFMANFGSHQSSIAGFNDAIIAKFDSTGIKSWCSYFGGSFNEVGNSCSVDTSGHVYMSGITSSTNGIAYNGSGVYQESRQVAFGVDLFLTQFNTDNGTNNWGTYYGGDTDEEAGNCVTDLAGNIFICGTTVSTNGTSIASAGSYQSVHGGGSRDAFIAKIDTYGKRKWGTYYGNSGYDVGSACTIDKDSIVYLTGYTLSSTGFATSGALQTTNAGTFDGFLVKFSLCSPFTATTDTTINVSCFGGSNGEITLNTPTGGTSPYTYEWSGNPDGDATLSIFNLNAGTYTCDIFDNEGCASQKTVSITEPSVLSSSISSQTNILCFGANTGAATISVSGGTAPYSYSWSPSGGTTATISGKSAGTYTCTITDANGCTKTQNVTLTEPTSLSVNTSATPVSCNGGSNGAGLVMPNGGTAPYTYLWAHNSATISNQFGLSAGTYSCAVTDANSCLVLGFIMINEPLAITSTTLSIQNVNCNGGSDGSISINAFGGSGAYSYSWTPFGGATSSPTNVPAGSYTCTITDGNMCTKTHSVTVGQPSPLAASVASKTNVLCNGASTGSITLTVTGGSPAYTYSWSNGGSTATISSLSAGTYTCNITDAHACTTSIVVSITEPASAISSSISSQTNILCHGGSTGLATVSASGGTGAFTYSWSPSGGSGTTATGLSAGTYTVTITDANACTKTQTATITQPAAALTGTTIVTNVACFGGTSGSVNLTPAGGTTPYSFDWGGGITTEDRTSLTAGSYSVTITDANGCTATASATVTQPASAVSGTTVTTNIACFGGTTGAINLTPAGGTTPYTFDWGGGITTEDRTGLVAGSYSVTITDANGCTANVSSTITQPTSAVTGTTVLTNIACFGGTSGAINLTATGGTTPYTFDWGGGITTEDRTSLSAGSYAVTITDANGCTAIVSSTITQPAAALTVTTVTTNVACFGGTTGAVNLTPAGGTAPFTFDWGGGITTEDRTSLSAGSYSVTITDANGCTATASATVTQPASAVSGTTVTTNIACFGGTTGAINLTPAGGTTPYTFDWGGGITTEDRTGLVAGTYAVTITDANGCTATASATVTQPASAVTGTTVLTNIACFGGTSGAINLTATGGTTPYTFDWGGGVTTEDRTSLSAGSYAVTITDANGCTATVSVTVTQPSALTSSISSQTNVLCFGANTGAATVSASGGTGAFTYSWSPSGGTAATASGLTAGTYTVTITDANACTKTQSATITQPLPLVVSIASNTNVLCNGAATGSMTSTVTGGVPSYSYLWSTGGTSSTISGLSAGSYTCYATDANGCTTSVSSIITQPAASLTGTAITTNVACFGGTAGAINLTATGGTAPYSFDWGGGITTEDRTGLSVGTYGVTITDANGCTATASATVTQPTALASSVGSQTNVACNGGSNGSATVSVSGGTASYTYSWSPSGGTAASETGLTAGSYTCTITDANACTKTQTVTITQPSAITSSVSSQTNVACNGGSNGAASIAVSGGAGPYNYSWSPSGGTAAAATGLTAGVYTCTITDANSCNKTQSVTITQPTALSATSVITNVSCNGGSNGAIDVTVTGGASPYTYSWDSGETTQDLSALTAGSYTDTVTDANGCKSITAYTITEPTALTSSVSSQTNILCNGSATGSATVVASGGTGSYTYSWAPSGGNSATASGLSAGAYTCTITDANGCTSTESVTITQLSAIGMTNTGSNVNCFGESNGAIDINVTGGTVPYTYDWGGGITTEDRTALIAGSYTVVVTDANSCTGAFIFSVTQPAILASNIAITNASCYASSDGELDITVTGGTAPYAYFWNSSITSEDLTTQSAGTYSVQISDAHGCALNDTAVITQPTEIISATVITNVDCFGNSNGAINIVPSGGFGPYTYDWGGGITTEDRTGLIAGNYSITITDATSCVSNISVIVTEPALLSATNSFVNINCFGASTGSIDLTVTGGTVPYTYNWGGGLTSEDLANIPSGNYAVSVTDAHGCTTASSATLVQPTAIMFVKDSLNILCFGDNSGMADVTVSGGVGPYSYSWVGTSAFTSTANYLTAGNYSVEITDNNGCLKIADFALTQNPAITSSFSVSQCDPYTWESNYYSNSGTYQQVFTAANGCDSTVTLSLVVYGYPGITITASETIICQGESVSLNASGGIATATWDNGVVNNQVFVPAATNTYTASVSNAQGCETVGSIDVFVRDLPTVFMENFADSTCIDANMVACPFATPAAGTFSGNGVTGVLLNTQTAGLGQHEIVYTYSDQYGCTNSDTSTVNIVECELLPNETGVEENAEIQLLIYPNPSNGAFNIECQQEVSAIVTDAVGRVIQFIEVPAGKSMVSLSNEADGVYFILVNHSQSVYRLVKQ